MESIRAFAFRLRAYWTLLKSLQAGLLTITGLAGYMSARCPVTNWQALVPLIGSLFLVIGGSTVLNMVCDRKIDLRMKRTCRRPLPSGIVGIREATALGLILAGLGVAWAVSLNPLYGLVIFAGLFFDVVIYTIWLKQRTPWSFVWGGIAGGMPIMAGRVLGTGQIDLVGVLMALTVLCWIPIHILTFAQRRAEEYRLAGVPVLPNTHGERFSSVVIGLAAGTTAVLMMLTVWQIGLRAVYIHTTLGMSAVLLALALVTVMRTSHRMNLALFKMASLYMLGSAMMIILGT